MNFQESFFHTIPLKVRVRDRDQDHNLNYHILMKFKMQFFQKWRKIPGVPSIIGFIPSELLPLLEEEIRSASANLTTMLFLSTKIFRFLNFFCFKGLRIVSRTKFSGFSGSNEGSRVR